MRNQLGSTVSMYVSESTSGVIIKVQVQTRASRDEVVGPHGDLLKVRITAAPVAGAANKHLLKFLAKQLKIPQSNLSLKSGGTSKNKSIFIQGITGAEVRERFQVK
jgi:uncharacterized protein (TIGR00251 family)